MYTSMLQQATHMATRIGHVFVATAGAENTPHMAVARRMTLKDPETLHVQQWFCPGTIENLRSNSHVSLVVWDRNTDRGYQIIGETERLCDTGVTDCYFPRGEGRSLPQNDNQLVIKVTKVVGFTRSAHTDSGV